MLGCTGWSDHAGLLHGALGDLLGDATSTGSCQLLGPTSEGCMLLQPLLHADSFACKQGTIPGLSWVPASKPVSAATVNLLEPTQTESAARKPG